MPTNELEETVNVHNLATDEVISFDRQTEPTYAVRYGYCYEHDRLPWLFTKIMNGEWNEIALELPVEVGKVSVMCGNWAALLRQFD